MMMIFGLLYLGLLIFMYMNGMDNTLILIIPPFAFSLWAQYKVNSTFNKFSEVPGSFTGAEIAKKILESNGIFDVPVEHISGHMTDHYDPSSRVIRLSDSTYNNNSIAAMAVAAHEVGHAIQHSKAYAPLVFRNIFAPVASFASRAWMWIVIAGMFGLIPNFYLLATVVFGIFAVFSIITLPVEFDASHRALVTLENDGYLDSQFEMPGAKKVLNAAAMTYVASAAVAIMQFIRLLLILRGNDE